jgi:asparagine synthase (glutamine-hydrolysing)
MCGILAVLSKSGPIRDDFQPYLEMIAHRGPDGSGTSTLSLAAGREDDRRDRAWLGHRRLAIIDPDPRANQPMTIADGRYTMVFNGEIYNYPELRLECIAAGWSFATQSDSEVLMACWALWGERAVARFVGMFAFVIVDREKGQAWLARDAFGIKPLHYAHTRDRLLICSEIPPLLATGQIPFAIEPEQAAEFIRFGASVELVKTPIEGVLRLPAGTVAKFDFQTGTLEPPSRFWAPATGRQSIGFTAAVNECRERFLDNVRLHLRSDVPVGAALSGGLDSSSIVCAIKHLEPDLRLHTFSFISAEPGQSEERWVDIVNNHIGAHDHKVVPRPGDLQDDLEDLVMAQGEPFGSASMYAQYRVFRMAREAGVPVTLDGQGADELLGGYLPFVATHGAAQVRRARLDRALRIVIGAGDTAATRARLAAQLCQALLPNGAIGAYRRAVGKSVLPPFFHREWLAEKGVTERNLAAAALGNYDGLVEHLTDTAVRTSLPTLLRIADRSSMAFSVESRVPFLTPSFADFLLTLPAEYLISGQGERKHVFREAMRGIVPEPIRQRRDKIGFAADDSIWLRHNREQFLSYLADARDLPLFDRDAVDSAVCAFYEEGRGSAQQIWRIFIFAIWARRMKALAG